jgi:hypothetical protein
LLTHFQELRAKLEDSRQEVEKLEAQLQEVGGQHAAELQEKEEKVSRATVLLCASKAYRWFESVCYDVCSARGEVEVEGVSRGGGVLGERGEVNAAVTGGGGADWQLAVGGGGAFGMATSCQTG